MSINTYIINATVGDAVKEFDDLFTIEYLDDWYVTCENVDGFLFHLGIGAYLDVEHVGASTASLPAFDDGFSVYDVTLPAVVRR